MDLLCEKKMDAERSSAALSGEPAVSTEGKNPPDRPSWQEMQARYRDSQRSLLVRLLKRFL